MFTNERLFTIQAFTIGRVHCTMIQKVLTYQKTEDSGYLSTYLRDFISNKLPKNLFFLGYFIFQSHYK